MVKDSKPRSDVVRSHLPRKKPGPTPDPASARSDRLVLRTHPNLMAILTARAEERGISRSQYIEKILIGWCNLDPRNRRLDLNGKLIEGATRPKELREKSPLAYAERWQRFASASDLVLGSSPPREWFDVDDDQYVLDADPNVNIVAPDDEDPPPRWRRGK